MSDKILMPKELTAENGAKYLFLGEFKEIIELQCSECDGHGMIDGEDDVCEFCDGAGSYNQEVNIEWDTIKSIYKMAVDNLGESK